jgi:hypothetical protein
VAAWEAEASRELDFLVKMRADAYWLADAPAPGLALDARAVSVKACLAWDGLNDKVAVVPRKYAAPWMRLLEAYYDHTLAGYKNSEQFQLALSRRFHVPVKAEKYALAVQDFYFWLPDVRGRSGCFPWNYVGRPARVFASERKTTRTARRRASRATARRARARRRRRAETSVARSRGRPQVRRPAPLRRRAGPALRGPAAPRERPLGRVKSVAPPRIL